MRFIATYHGRGYRLIAPVTPRGDRDDQFRILIDLARLAILREDFALAREQAASAREIAESLENRDGAALAEAELARIAVARGANER